MARRKKSGVATTTTSGGTDVVVVQAPTAAPIERRRRGGGGRRRRSTGRRRRRGGSIARVAGYAASEKHTLTAVGSALALGLVQRAGIKIPTFAGLSPQAVAGIGSWVYARMTKSQTAAHVATGLLSVAAYMFGTGTLPAGTIVGQHYVVAPETYNPYPGTAAVMSGDDDDDVEGDDEDDEYG